MSRPDSTKETVEIPQWLRDQVDERDQGHCRMCGRFLDGRRAIHHINFGGDLQGMGGRRRHELDNVVSLCWLPGDGDCHARAHSRKRFWQEWLTQAISSERNVTAFQLARWATRERRTR